MDHLLFKNGMRRLASGVSLITTERDGVRHGMACTSVTSVSAEPPTVLVCINKNASSHDHIEASGIFCVNLLSSADRHIASAFSSSADRETRFRNGEWVPLATGAPALLTAEASFDCRVVEKISIHTHTIFVGAVVAAELSKSGMVPLVYHDGTYSTVAAVA